MTHDSTSSRAGKQGAGPAARSTDPPTGGTAGRAATFRGDHADNTVVLRGRVSSAPTERQLPSGAVIITLRVSVARARTVMTSGSSQNMDWVDCTAWSVRARRTVSAWQLGDPVEVTGALRRRFFRAGVGPSTRLDVEVLSGRRVRPADAHTSDASQKGPGEADPESPHEAGRPPGRPHREGR